MRRACEVKKRMLSFSTLYDFSCKHEYLEAVDCIVDPNDTLENKEIALDNLEMVRRVLGCSFVDTYVFTEKLIEGIDNAMSK